MNTKVYIGLGLAAASLITSIVANVVINKGLDESMKDK